MFGKYKQTTKGWDVRNVLRCRRSCHDIKKKYKKNKVKSPQNVHILLQINMSSYADDFVKNTFEK